MKLFLLLFTSLVLWGQGAAWINVEYPPGIQSDSCFGPTCFAFSNKQAGCTALMGMVSKYIIGVRMYSEVDNCVGGYAYTGADHTGYAYDGAGDPAFDAITGIAGASQYIVMNPDDPLWSPYSTSGTTIDTDSCNAPYVTSGPFQFNCYNFGGDPGGTCDVNDPGSSCYQPPCDPSDPNGNCYSPCDGNDPNSSCYQPPCDPNDPASSCYTNCDPNDPSGSCYGYVQNPVCDPNTTDCNTGQPYPPPGCDPNDPSCGSGSCDPSDPTCGM